MSFAIERGEHVALVGPNGSGKTTLLETILRGPLGHGVVPAYFSQHEQELDRRGSVLDCAQSMTGLKRPQAQALLGRFLFSGWHEHDKPVSALSGGERRRLALAVVVASGANFLLLDEPTNHLDLESREALEAALEAFRGTVLLVSHDRALIDAVAQRTLAIEDGAVRSYEGGWADLARHRSTLALPGGQTPGTVPPGPVHKGQPKPRPAHAALSRPSELERVEAEIETKEEAVAELERRLAEDWAQSLSGRARRGRAGPPSDELLAAHRRARTELEALLERWEALFEGATVDP